MYRLQNHRAARARKLEPVTWAELLERLKAGQDERTLFLPQDLSPDELARYAVGLANHKGGTLFLGVSPEGRVLGAAEIHPLQITHALFQLTQGLLLPYVEVLEGPEGRVLALHVPKAPAAIALGPGRVPFWDGARLTELKLGEARPEPDFTAQVLPAASLSDLDPLEVLRLRRILEERGSALAALPDLELLFALGLIERVEGEERPTVAGLLLAGTPLALRRLLPQAEVSYYFHQDEEGYAFREDLLRPIPALLERLRDLIQARNRVRYLTVGLFRIEVWDFDQEVYREALLNALVHRDWQSLDAIQVHHHPDRLEVSNPGGFPPGITPENVLRHPPKRRNPRLAEALYRLGYVERAGSGVDKMYRLLLKYGKEPPEYRLFPEALTLVLYNPELDEAFVRGLAEAQERHGAFSLDHLIVLGHLRRVGRAALEELARALQLPPESARRVLHRLERMGLLLKEGGRYRLQGQDPLAQRLLAALGAPRTRRELEALLGLSPKEVLALLRRLMGEGRVLREGRGPGTRYRRA
ncbi:putative transcriptional regulator with HTH domain [Thermus oshimai JL-2]|uniref:Putative transcriptional regulator with HTH domain n=1 Tax=Thermus oshimai JL-2 TaxID=751945 RepID=K7R7M2_THEOS|nr:putative transcriptional regulator with HTH domain [Thermus oshimai JL-2]